MNCEKYLPMSILLAQFLTADAVNATEIYQWVDQNGVTHFSDTPPENGENTRSLAPATASLWVT